MALRIVTDSTADIRGEEVEKLGIEVVPLNVLFGQKSYLDGVDLGPEEFYKLLQTEKEFPRTSQPAPGEFMKIFSDAKEKGDEVLYLGVSSGLSGTFNSASIASNEIGYDGIHLFDTLESIQALHLMVEIAVKMKDDGEPLQKILDEMDFLKHHIKTVSSIDTLTYLKKGGRLSGAAAFIGNIIGLKIFVDLDLNGKIRVCGKCLGGKAALKLLSFEVKNNPPMEGYPLSYGYTDKDTNMILFKNKMEETMGEKDYFISQIGPAIGSHIGPGGFDLAYVCAKERK